MNSLIGLLIVTLAVVGGFSLANGPFHVLFQPTEYVVIIGTAFGAMVASAPFSVLLRVFKSLPTIFRGSRINRLTYYQLMGLLLTIFNVIRKEGVLGIEADLEDPTNSPRFNRYPKIAENKQAMDLIVGSLRLFVDGVVNAFDLDRLMETEINTNTQEVAVIPSLMTKIADALPGIGIVAAVLGIIITMQHIDAPPAVIGHSVADALVGTFLGILLSYGYMQPMSATLERINYEREVLLNSIRSGIVAFAGGAPPTVAIEFARKTIESNLRPTIEEIEQLQQEIRRENRVQQ